MILIYKFCNVLSIYIPKAIITCDSLLVNCSRQVLGSTTDEIHTRVIYRIQPHTRVPLLAVLNSNVAAKSLLNVICYNIYESVRLCSADMNIGGT